MRYEEFPPAADLAPIVLSHWAFEIDAADRPSPHVVVPDGTVSIVYIRGEIPRRRLVSLLGPRVEALRRDPSPGDIYWGTRLRPGLSAALLRVPAPALRDRAENAAERLPELTRRLIAGLASAATSRQAVPVLEREIRRLARRMGPLDTASFAAARALQESHGVTSVGALAVALGVPPRQLRRRFRLAVGLGPKEFARVQRLRWACIQALGARPLSWADLAGDAGFADQAHLAREVRRLMGLPPGALARRLGRIAHTNLRA